MKVIEPAQTDYALPLLFVQKNRPLGFCVNHLKIDAVSIRDSCHLPRMDYRIDPIEHAKIFSTLDENRGFLKIEVHKGDRENTLFTSHYCL